jgi:pimeloyl-ACP methyl ester carboxylesterase
VLAPDFVGWGLGDRLDREYSFAYLVDFVREFQDALDLTRTHVVGHSMGGWIATLPAYESPQRIDRLVLVASGGAATRTLHSMTSFQPPTREQIETQLRNTVQGPKPTSRRSPRGPCRRPRCQARWRPIRRSSTT